MAPMNVSNPFLVSPKIPAVLDPDFRPAALAVRAFEAAAETSGRAIDLGIAIEQADGSTVCFRRKFLPPDHPHAAANSFFL